jgi:hypothetical protein
MTLPHLFKASLILYFHLLYVLEVTSFRHVYTLNPNDYLSPGLTAEFFPPRNVFVGIVRIAQKQPIFPCRGLTDWI